ncbi:MAG: peptidoglycan DD-metalloendopeptidase family protein [Desulfobacterales bacterium]|nr:peptidoglycan DD-metalloendopeptidase family protein [Desulfobacterales bacterium]
MVRLLFLFKTISKALSLSLVGIFFIAQVVVTDPVSSQLHQSIERERAQMKAVREKISRGKQHVRKLEAEEATVMGQLERLNLQLNQSQKRLRKIHAEIEELQARLGVLTGKHDRLVVEIQQLETYAARRLVASYKLGELGMAPILFSAESFFDLCQRREALQRILAKDAKEWDKLQTQKRRLRGLYQRLMADKLMHNRLCVRLKEEQSAIAEKRAGRAKLLTRIRSQKNLTFASIASLKKAARELDEAIGSLERRIKPPPASARREPGAFLALKGSLPMPAPGDLVGHFGAYVKENHYNIKTFRGGVNIRAGLGTPVRAVWKGHVIYADWLKGYGNIMILDHGDHYYTLSAQLDRLFKKTGDAVQAGEVLATVGDTGTIAGPGLYFEIRHHGKPLDPVLWFKK